MPFHGFSEKTIEYLRNLELNNNKQWFESHKKNYEEYLLEPFKNFVSDLGEFMLSINPNIEIRPAVSKTISRIYRDTRFSKDKSPYRPKMWASFKRLADKSKDYPVFYFGIDTIAYVYGMGYYSAEKSTMDKLRTYIDNNPNDFINEINFYKKQNIFSLEGEMYKKILDKSKSEEINTWYQRKNLYFIYENKIDNTLFSEKIISDIIKAYKILTPFYNFLSKLID